MDKRILPNEILLEEAGSLLNEGREVTFTPLGSSMLPFIRGGRDSVRLRKKPDVEVGDIILVRLPGRYVLHRLVRVDGDRLTLMGDGNIAGTESCTKADVMGTVVAVIKGNKEVVPGKGRLWHTLKPFRRYILAIYRRLI
ncbi:MAG: S24/S26 family peptidase [Bacteroidales bacterium]|nr:S24/S26 family peptidase [Bacteroidales bacterium]